MDAKHNGKGGVQILSAPSKDGRHAYTSNQARAIAQQIVDAAHEADAWTAAVAHQADVTQPSVHAVPPPVDESPPYTFTKTEKAVPRKPAAPKKRVQTQKQRDAANARRRAKRAAAAAPAKKEKK